MKNVMTLLIASASASASASFLVSATALAEAKQNHVSGFKYQTCKLERCVEVEATEASLSQLRFGFTTSGTTKLIIRDRNGRELQRASGTTATFHSELDLITLDSGNPNAFTTVDLNETELKIAGGGK